METKNTTKKVAQIVNLAKFARAEKAFAAGQPREIWARFLCEAYGLDHGLKSTIATIAAQCGIK